MHQMQLIFIDLSVGDNNTSINKFNFENIIKYLCVVLGCVYQHAYLKLYYAQIRFIYQLQIQRDAILFIDKQIR